LNQVSVIRYGSFGFVATGDVITHLWCFRCPVLPEIEESWHPNPNRPARPITIQIRAKMHQGMRRRK